jgi:hypothetical protein
MIYSGNIRVITRSGDDARKAAAKEEPGFSPPPSRPKSGRLDPSDTATIGTSGKDQRIRMRDEGWLCSQKDERYLCDPRHTTVRTQDLQSR